MKRLTLALSLLLACHQAGSPYGQVVERGGELGKVQLEDTKVQLGGDPVIAWGVLEVPDGSRMQATYAGVDAIARAELLKVLRVRIASVMVSVESTDPARNQAYERVVESVSGRLRSTGTTQHAWERVRHPDRDILRVWSRLAIPRADLADALHGTPELPPDMLEQMR